MALIESLVRPFPLCSQHQHRTLSPSSWGVAARQRTPPSPPSSSRQHNAASIIGKCVRLQERRRSGSLGFRRRRGLSIRAISSAGPFVSDWGEGGEERLNADEEEAKKEVVEEVKREKKRLIAGVDQTQLLEPHLLADPDSRFAEYYGVQIHHKIARPSAVSDVDSSPSSSPSVGSDQVDEQKAKLPAILLHGFGASLFSWERVMPKLAEVLGAPALAFDRPAFGFTSRTFPPSSPAVEDSPQQKFKNAYTVAFSAAATLAFIDFLKSDNAIVIGHSAGSLVAVDAYFQSPEKIAALILVAPAVVAPLLMPQMAASKMATKNESEKASKKESELEGEMKNETNDSFLKFGAALQWMWVKFTSFLRMVKKFVQLVFNKLVGFLFRSPPATWLVQRIMDKGGPWAVRTAFYDIVKADKYVVDGYTRPLQCRDWERALLEYCLALMNNTEDQASAKKKLHEVKCPVLVVTGDTDRIVPGWNSENLAKVFPNAEFKLIKNCGHLPHEETPDEFLEIIKDWLLRTVIKKTEYLEPAMS